MSWYHMNDTQRILGSKKNWENIFYCHLRWEKTFPLLTLDFLLNKSVFLAFQHSKRKSTLRFQS
ncbi:CLUMA_CG000593, isoform A [Clunio marinus]|uniref:CLUMA_CG000593, isoform A n=1 Tax=Clunio marinus TaxID=568069 RepID=A0A1J1HKJ4_9DIPT|nr:CLUMA_CG000593, isoform A [Clunio marinus]